MELSISVWKRLLRHPRHVQTHQVVIRQKRPVRRVLQMRLPLWVLNSFSICCRNKQALLCRPPPQLLRSCLSRGSSSTSQPRVLQTNPRRPRRRRRHRPRSASRRTWSRRLVELRVVCNFRLIWSTSYPKSCPDKARSGPPSPSRARPPRACLTTEPWWSVAKFTSATCRVATKSTPRVPTSRPTNEPTRARSLTNAPGKAVAGASRGPTSWQGITASTPVQNPSSVISAIDNSRGVITCLYTWRGTNLNPQTDNQKKSSHVEYWN